MIVVVARGHVKDIAILSLPLVVVVYRLNLYLAQTSINIDPEKISDTWRNQSMEPSI